MKALRFLGFAIILCTLLAAVGSAAQEEAKPNPLQPEPLVLTPPASAAPQGSWSYIPTRGYLWLPVATAGMTEAEWAPWDPWWIMPYGQWAWAEGYGWGWTPMIPYHSMSPLGWGFDSWYGGWYGFTPDGNPSNTMAEYIPPGMQSDRERAQAWVNGHGGAYKGHDPDARNHARVKINTVVAAPPPSLAPPSWRGGGTIAKVQDAMADQGKGFAQSRDRGDRQHGQGAGKNHGKGQGQGKLQGGGGGGRVEPGHGSAPPAGGYGGGMSAGRSSGGGQPKKH
jgi:hypothetical protein